MSQSYNVAGLDLPDVDESSKLYRIWASAMQQHLERSPLALHCPLIRLRNYQTGARHRSTSPVDDLLSCSQILQERYGTGPQQDSTSASISHQYREHSQDIPHCEAYWNAAYFGLDRVTLFQESNPEDQQGILSLANLGLLQEAYCIEKAGMGYMSRMVLLAESIQERMIYTLFAADETSHFVQLYPYLPVEPTVTDNPFLHLLSEVVDGEDKTVLLFVIQVVLEGWGLSHYRSLAKDCTHEVLGKTLQGFLQDESRHQATGVTLFNKAQLSHESHAAIVEILGQFLHMVQVGPQGVLEALARVKGHLSRQQKIQILEELDTEHHSGTRLQVLRSLMRGDGAGAIVQDLDEQGAFRPFAAHQCV